MPMAGSLHVTGRVSIKIGACYGAQNSASRLSGSASGSKTGAITSM